MHLLRAPALQAEAPSVVPLFVDLLHFVEKLPNRQDSEGQRGDQCSASNQVEYDQNPTATLHASPLGNPLKVRLKA
jgi:hypothetical protein